MLHIDLKELVVSVGGYRYVLFAIDEYTRYVFVEFLKAKSEAATATERVKAAFEATVGTPVDEHGRALPRPRVRHVHSDHEGKLVSAFFREWAPAAGIHHTLSPPHITASQRAAEGPQKARCRAQGAVARV